MELIKCRNMQLDLVSDMYGRVVKHLEETVNYPKWSKNYPCRESVEDIPLFELYELNFDY